MNRSFPAMFAVLGACLACAPAALASLLVSNLGGDQVLRADLFTGVVGSPPLLDTPPGLDEPHGLLDLGSHVLVASFATNSILRQDSFTCDLTTFAGPSSGLVNPVYIRYRTGGEILVSSQGTDEILRFTEGGAPLGTLVAAGSGGLDGPSGFAIAGGVLYVAGRHSGNVLSYDAATGAFLGVIADASDGLGAGSTFGLQVAPNGDLYVASNGAVRRIDLATNTVVAVIPMELPIGLEISSGDVLVATGGNIRRIDADTDALSAPLLSNSPIGTLNFFTVDVHADPACVADLSGDGQVNSGDLAFLLGAWGPGSGPTDLNGDGVVNASDLAVLLGSWGWCSGQVLCP